MITERRLVAGSHHKASPMLVGAFLRLSCQLLSLLNLTPVRKLLKGKITVGVSTLRNDSMWEETESTQQATDCMSAALTLKTDLLKMT